MAVRYNGTNAMLGRTTSTSSSAWSAMCWFYIVTAPGSGAYAAAIRKIRTTGDDSLEILNQAGTLKLVSWDGTTETIGSTISATTWYHLALVRESNTVLKVYLNGALDHTGGTASASATSGLLNLGAWDAGTDLSNSRMAAFKFFTAGLTLAQIELERDTISPLKLDSILMWLPMLPGTGERTRDYSGGALNFTETGTITDEDPPPVAWGARSGKRMIAIAAAATKAMPPFRRPYRFFPGVR